ncbi:BlaI/MecI/CopY family transcriptional regulator [Alkaliphilus peptidifermentans]|uniref:BlaI family transcriptional regulator, penicillinase repressor n=1 Tax=Alkaliphilus peptidifermentans DSM 18978 TaxID=1120976 RepID=A0A1G5E981_9FIRM|nr:BlaI/MecI/CopY family transcriptional regulator [Alkaliphilus peptidifermentans]SCY23539.1 BlaI family transcriptional regulator, penicillinase repressor [Alkaliphilus peptidifermentans DSM 18978]
MSMLPTISEAEYEVMKIIWSNEPISTNEVVDKLLESSSWTPKTIQTLLSRLVKKGVLDYTKNSRIFVYTSLIKQEDYVEKESKSFLNKFYNGAINSMLVNFIESNKLTNDEIHELKKMLDERLDKGGK